MNAYYDVAGVLTIGYGHSIYAPSIEEYPIHEGQHITEEEGENILRADLKPTEAVVNSAVTREITQKQYDALVSFTFNLGAGTFKSSDVLEFTNQGIIRPPRMLCCNTRTLVENSSRGCISVGRRKGLCIFLRFPKHKIQCGTMSGR